MNVFEAERARLLREITEVVMRPVIKIDGKQIAHENVSRKSIFR